eukprot:CAMPEP_0178902614 /NCGR_PEP_ID=MMETSP0786-20121207/4704_1 /TAXON_ID=186022 /ORGANISM="Thalassionema frauenfeldii, Strain CCMP 1798" /LENGTH=290 /DNA_ID=CAMNT_0020573903 /DNA_START=49 /DNA_END=922 /DNA_ORIENTATION=-
MTTGLRGILQILSILLSTPSDPSSLILPVLFETDHLAVVAKPPCVACHRTEIKTTRGRNRVYSSGKDENGMHILKRAPFPHHQNIHLVHRLDAVTSGCLLLAFSSVACRQASEALANRGQKTYYSLCRGHGQGLRDRGGPFIVSGDVKDSKGIKRQAETEIEGLWGSSKPRRCCLVRSRPRTGRWHQIRQHLGRENFPIVGETRHHKDIGENRAWKEILDELGIQQRAVSSLSSTKIDGDLGGLVENGKLDVKCPLPFDMRTMISLTDWAKEAQNSLPELFETYPTTIKA